MRTNRSIASGLTTLFVVAALWPLSANAGFDGALRWRNVGPFRGGRTHAIAGVPSQPNVFYMAQVNGGVFKTTDYGRTWQPIFDDQPTGSIGAIAVSISNPDIVYVGSGEGLHRPDLSIGDGIYKSTDAGKTWAHLGLRDGQQIPQITVDPRNPDRVFVAVGGHPYGPNEERGIFRSLDGGKTFEKVLYRDENTGGGDVQVDPTNSDVVYASLWESREGPWENSTWNGTNGGIFKSTDGGKSWNQLRKGLPDKIVQANLAISPSSPGTLLATVKTLVTSNIFRSEDGGESWVTTTDDARPAAGIGGGELPIVKFDPKNPAIVYSTSIVCWKSIDGGKTWEGWRGAPGGDDYQNIWINPDNPNIVLLGSDQGAVVTVNGGQSWSSWYNQPTAQLYHVSADNAFPYRLYSGQQESGSVGIASRGNDGRITFRDWHPVAAEEYGYVVADPLDPGHHLRRQVDALRSAHRTSPGNFTGAIALSRFSDAADAARRLFSDRSAPPLLFRKHALANTRRRTELETDQPRSDAQELRIAGQHWKISQRPNGTGEAAGSDLCRRAVAYGCESDLVRNR